MVDDAAAVAGCAGAEASAGAVADATELFAEGFGTDFEGGAVSVGASGTGPAALPAVGGCHFSLEFFGLEPSIDPVPAPAATDVTDVRHPLVLRVNSCVVGGTGDGDRDRWVGSSLACFCLLELELRPASALIGTGDGDRDRWVGSSLACFCLLELELRPASALMSSARFLLPPSSFWRIPFRKAVPSGLMMQ